MSENDDMSLQNVEENPDLMRTKSRLFMKKSSCKFIRFYAEIKQADLWTASITHNHCVPVKLRLFS